MFIFNEVYMRFTYLFPSAFGYPFFIIKLPYFNALIGVFIATYAIYWITRNYENEVRPRLYERPLNWVRTSLIERAASTRKDLIRFIGVTLLITFFADLFFASVSEESIFSLIPGLDIVENVLTSSPNLPLSLKAGQVEDVYGYLPGPPLGALVLFILRQIRFKASPSDYPGSRVLFLFLVFVPILLAINIGPILYEGITKEISVESFSEIVEPALVFVASNIFQPGFYVLTSATWIFDWYLYSMLWKKPKDDYPLDAV
jgi:hypothetical protein